MSILIEGMKMPKKCKQCWFFGGDSVRVGYCYLLKGKLPLPDGIPQDCPLIEVPKHSRLIDANPIMKFIQDGLNNGEFGYDQIKVMAEIQYAPTIIKGEDE